LRERRPINLWTGKRKKIAETTIGGKERTWIALDLYGGLRPNYTVVREETSEKKKRRGEGLMLLLPFRRSFLRERNHPLTPLGGESVRGGGKEQGVPGQFGKEVYIYWGGSE